MNPTLFTYQLLKRYQVSFHVQFSKRCLSSIFFQNAFTFRCFFTSSAYRFYTACRCNGQHYPRFTRTSYLLFSEIALTFDAAWGNEDTADLLSILARNQIHATFFLTGSWVDAYPDDVKAIAAAGHDIGNHSQTHPEMSTLSKEQIRDELMQVHKNVKELTGQNMCFFRPPYGDYNNLLIQTATECGYLSIQWDIDSLDWKDYGVQSIIDRTALNPELSNGSIILMHNGAKYTKDALETVISTLQSKGYEFVTLSELVYKDHFHMDPSGKQIPD